MLALAACDDPLRVRPAPVDTRMAVFMIMEPLHPIQPVEIQETPGLPNTAAEIVVQSGDSLVASVTAVPPTMFSPAQSAICAVRHGLHAGTTRDSLSWTTQCVPVGFDARYGAAYRVTVAREGRRTATGSTVVPGDFDIVESEISGDPPRRVTATWTRSAGTHRYLVALGGVENMIFGGPCEQHSCARWFAVTQDTAIVADIDPRFVENTRPPYSVSVWAVSRELLEGITTGATSGFFPIPPTQNVTGGMGTIGAWVRRWFIRLEGVEFRNGTAGVRVANTSDVNVRYVVRMGGPNPDPCSFENTACGSLAPGDSTIVARADMPTSGEALHGHIVVCPQDRSCISLPFRL